MRMFVMSLPFNIRQLTVLPKNVESQMAEAVQKRKTEIFWLQSQNWGVS